MNYSKLFTAYIPLKKCGSDPVSAGIIGGVNLASSIYGVESQKDINRENVKNQREENEKSRQFNHDEAELARQWQADQWNHQFEVQSAEWYNQMRQQQLMNRQNFQFEAEYNSPENQTKRLAAAGYNPSAGVAGNSGMVAAASGNLQNQGSISVPSGGSLSGAQASSSAANMPQQVNPLSGSSIVGTLMKDLAEAYNKSAITRPTVEDISAGVRLKVVQAAGQELVNTFQGLQNFVLEKTKNTKVQQALQDLSNSAADTFLKLAQGSEVNSKTLLNKADLAIKSIEKELKGMDLVEAKFRIANMETLFKAQLYSFRASAASAFASANKSNAEAATVNASRHWIVEHDQWVAQQGRLDYEIKVNESILSDKTVQSRIKASVSQAENLGLLNDEIKKRIILLEKEGDWYEINTIISAISSVGTMVSKFKD